MLVQVKKNKNLFEGIIGYLSTESSIIKEILEQKLSSNYKLPIKLISL